MKWVGRLSSLVCVLVAPSVVHAAPAAGEDGGAAGVPPARVGFQMAVRTGYSLPMGKASDDADSAMSDIYSGQVPIFFDVGGKVIPNLFVGGYLGLGFGGTAGRMKTVCEGADVSCYTLSVRLGVELQYHFLPAAFANPWVGYGLGFESSAVSISASGRSGTVSMTGFEFARFGAGVDLRVSRVFGIGPFVDFSLGSYSRLHYEVPGSTDLDGEIENKATHEWLTFGVRGVFFP